MTRKRILIVEDEKITALEMSAHLRQLGYQPLGPCASGEEAVTSAYALRPDAILMDIVLNGPMDGIQAAEAIRSTYPCPVIYVTAHADQATLDRAKVTEPSGYVLKPINERELHIAIEIALNRHKLEEKLRESEERYRTAIENSNDGVVITQEGKHVYVNHEFLKMFGYSDPEEILNKSIADAPHIHPDDLERIVECNRQRLRGEPVPLRYEHKAIHKDGRTIYVELSSARIMYQGKAASLSYMRDITERKEAEEALRASEERHRTILQTAMDGVWLADTQGRLLEVNEAYCRMSGYSAQGLLAMRIPDLEAAETDDDTASRIQKIMAKGEDRFESRHRRKDGSIFDVEVSVQYQPVEGGRLVVFVRDITERKKAEEKIRASLREKEVLLKEIHHRVKNNLQIVSSLLFLQASRTKHPEAVSVLRESRNRIRSMALIHERLYASPNLGSVDMGKYTRNLVSDLRRSYRPEDSSVRLTLTVEDISLRITEAIPCGLIINELVSNALKHAFPKGKEGELTIQLQRGNTNQVTLTASDNGIGLPEHVDFQNSPSLGLTLINSLVEQLNGTIELDRRVGTVFTITFAVSG